MASVVFTSILGLVYTLLSAILLLFSSFNNDDPWSTPLSLLIFLLFIFNGLLHYLTTQHENTVERRIEHWIRETERLENIKCSLIKEDGKREEVPFHKLTTGNIVINDEKLSFILKFISDPSFTQKDKIRISEPAISFLARSLSHKKIKPSIFIRVATIIKKFDIIFVPVATISTILGLIIAYLFSEPEEDYSDQRFDIGVCILVIIPLLRINLPTFVFIHILCDNLIIMYHFSLNKSFVHFFAHINLKEILIDKHWISMSLRLSPVTGVSSIDKKGILATSQPVLEKLFFVTSSEGEASGEVLHLSSDIGGSSITHFSFDDIIWHRFINSICPLIESIRVNGCTNDEISPSCLCAIRQLIPPHISNVAEESIDPITFNVFRNRIGGENESENAFKAQCSVVAEGEFYRLHMKGSPSLLLPMCTTYWDGNEVKYMTDKTIGLFSDFAARHSITSHCVAISCATISNLPLLPIEDCEWITRDQERKISNYVQASFFVSSISDVDLSNKIPLIPEMESTPQTFLALASSQEQALPSIFEMVESFQSSCVRFKIFSSENQLRSRIIGEKLGLEAGGWNCHISLKNECTKTSVIESTMKKGDKGRRRSSLPNGTSFHSLNPSIPSLPPNMARLPTGIHEIRPHLNEVDNVPLLVSLFTDCTVETTREMIDILHEYNESELVLGSVVNSDNLLTLMKGEFSIGVYPLDVSACIHKKNEERMEGMASLGADLIVDQKQISFLPQILSFCRQRSSLFNQSLSFYFISSLSLSLHYLISIVLILPFPISSFNAILLTFMMHPLLTLSISYHNDRTPRIALSSSLHLLHNPYAEFFFYHFPHLITLSITHYLMIVFSGKISCFIPFICTWINPTNPQSSIHQIESGISFLRIISLLFSSTPHIYPYENSYRRLPIFNPFWSIVAIISLTIQVYFSHSGTFSTFSPSIIVVYILLSSISILIAQSYKRTNVRIFRKENRRRKFGFDTKLGMNSPY